MKSGFVSIIGRPNTGKSTLLNTIINNKIAIVSDVAGTTRNSIHGVYNDSETQIVFVDTPGIHKPQDKLGRELNKEAYSNLSDIDLILFIVDASIGIGKGDKFIINALKNNDVPVILILNKIDKLNNEGILNAINSYKDLYDFAEIVPISALKNDNVDRLLKVVKTYLNDTVKYYDDGVITNASKYFLASEFVREKILELTKDEIPHSVTCVTTNYQEKSNVININVDIIVDRSNLKKIIIGKGGKMLREIGSRARVDLENALGKQIYLELYVKTIEDWRDKERYLKEFGIIDE